MGKTYKDKDKNWWDKGRKKANSKKGKPNYEYPKDDLDSKYNYDPKKYKKDN